MSLQLHVLLVKVFLINPPEVIEVLSVGYTGTMFTDFTLQDYCVVTVSLLLSPLLNALEPGWWNRGGSGQLFDPHDHCGPRRPWTFCDLLLVSHGLEHIVFKTRTQEEVDDLRLLQGLDLQAFNQAARILYNGNTSYVALMKLINCFFPIDYSCWSFSLPILLAAFIHSFSLWGSLHTSRVSSCWHTSCWQHTFSTISSVLVWWSCVAFCTVLLMVMCLDAFWIIWSHFTMKADAYWLLLWWLCEQF